MNAHPLPEAPVAPELCTLDELFASEMDIWTSIRRLGKDVNKNALILQKWGRASSNEAVSDVMFHSANVLIKFSLALVQFSTHGEIIRNRLQAIRDVTNTPEHASQYKLYAPSPPGSSPDILLKAVGTKFTSLLCVSVKTIVSQDPAKICYDSPTIIRDLMKQKFAGMEELARKCNELPSEEAVSATLAYKGKDRTAEIWHEAIREATQPRLGYLASRQDDEGGSETNNYGSPTPIEFDSSLSSLSSVTQERNRRWAIIDEDIKLVLARAGGAAINARLVETILLAKKSDGSFSGETPAREQHVSNDEVAQPLQVNVSPQERVLRGGMEATGKITIFMHAITLIYLPQSTPTAEPDHADPLPLFNTPSSPLRKMFKSRPSGGMLGSVGAKIAHASTITALGNPDLRTLQDLITAEKGVLVGVQRLAGEIGKSAETLKTWGLGEGDDLGDVLSHSTNLLAQFSAALTQYASYEEQIRTQMKSIRSREEDLDEMKRRKRNVDNKADGADKKLAKMSPEHKSRMAQVELLNELKEEGRRLEIDIVNEEAAIGDYKRRATREFLGLKFAGMVELAEKTTIIGDLGKLMIEQIPLYTTPPGQPRPLYTNREKTAELSSEAMRCIGEVRINPPVLPEPTPATTTFQPFNHYNNSGPATPGTDHVNGVTGSTMPRGPNNFNEFGESQYSGPGGSGFSTGSLRIGEDGSRVGNTGAGEFHTLPARTSGFGSGLPPITLGDHGRDDTFSSSIADALSHDPTFSPQHAPTPPPHEPPQSSHQPTAPVGTYAPPPGPPPGAYQPRQLSESYFSNALPDPTQSHSPLMPPHGSPWATTPSAPAYSRPLPVHPPPDAEGQVAGFTHERDISPPPVFHPPAPPAPPVPSTSPPPVSHTIQAPSPPPVLAMPASPVPAPAAPATPPAPPAANQPQPIPYADSLRDLSPSPPPVRDPSPAPAPRLDQHEASNPLVREESHEDIFAMYGSSNRNSAASPPPPPPQPQSPSNKPSLGVISAPTDALPPRTPSPPHIQTQESNYGTPSEYPNPFSSPLPRPPTLPTLSNVSPVTSPTSPGGSGRMISAGAFRRNVSRSDTLDPGSSLPPPVSPLSVRKKGLGGSEDISRGNSPVPASPGAPPIYSAIEGEGTSLGRSTSPPAGGFGGDSRAPQN
ncbi:Eisosome component PIL1, partial [Rhizoctonia solani]